jgi:hypothetical protein
MEVYFTMIELPTDKRRDVWASEIMENILENIVIIMEPVKITYTSAAAVTKQIVKVITMMTSLVKGRAAS